VPRSRAIGDRKPRARLGKDGPRARTGWGGHVRLSRSWRCVRDRPSNTPALARQFFPPPARSGGGRGIPLAGFPRSASVGGMDTAVLSAPTTAPSGIRATVSPRSTTAWPAYLLVFAAICITAGILWDISWHATIGRDTFWTPAHLMIYLGGTLGGCLGGWLAFDATFLRRTEWRDRSVGVLGGRAPLGALVAIWGAVAMLTSAPFDDWWHNAYGLDVKILSPPHSLLAAGMYGVVTGAVLLAAASRNRAPVPNPGSAGVAAWVVLAAIGIQLALASILLTELSYPNDQRTRLFYLASAALYPTFLVAAATYAPARWSATKVAVVYQLLVAGLVWLLPLFPAEPKLGPIYNHVTHLVPPPFPLLLVVPAVAIDLIFLGLRQRRGWSWTALRMLGAATAFTAVFLATQWYFSGFEISPAADNWFFAGHGRFYGYMSRRDDLRGVFWHLDRDPFTSIHLGRMWLYAVGATVLGGAAGTFLARIRR
jgi:hypothetical protein